MGDAEFETLSTRKVNYGNRNFIEISVRKAITEEKEVPFIYMTKGNYDATNKKKYKQNLTLPHNPEVLSEVIDCLENILANGGEEYEG